MTPKGPFQPKAFYDCMILWFYELKKYNIKVPEWSSSLCVLKCPWFYLWTWKGIFQPEHLKIYIAKINFKKNYLKIYI